MWKRAAAAFLPLLVLLALPLALRPAGEKGVSAGADTLVVITPHPEQVRREFDRAFRHHYLAKTGRTVVIDWRSVGGTSDIVRYIADRFEAQFRLDYMKSGGEWNERTAADFRNPKLDPEKSAVRKAFLTSETGIGIDIFFGGGTYDHNRFAQIGFAVPGGVEKRHPDWFRNDNIPLTHAGESIRDPLGRYYGVCLSSFGLAFNPDRLAEAGLPHPARWSDLTGHAYFQRIEIADPTKSGSINKCYEMILQQAMAESGPEKGWIEGFGIIRLIAANARCVTDSAGKLVRDVSSGAAAAGMGIDFYVFSEAEFTKSISGGAERILYRMPENGSSVSADPVELLRGAPNRKTAEAFLDFLLSEEGQALWMLKAGVPGGPEKSALLRPCVRRDLYMKIPVEQRSIGAYDPYESSGTFRYRGEWTGSLFNLIRVLIKCLALDPQDSLREAWDAVLENGGPERNPASMELIRALPFDLAHAGEASALLLSSPEKAAELRRRWTEFARENYRKAAALARNGAGKEACR